jgi:hypothetical protein
LGVASGPPEESTAVKQLYGRLRAAMKQRLRRRIDPRVGSGEANTTDAEATEEAG